MISHRGRAEIEEYLFSLRERFRLATLSVCGRQPVTIPLAGQASVSWIRCSGSSTEAEAPRLVLRAGAFGEHGSTRADRDRIMDEG